MFLRSLLRPLAIASLLSPLVAGSASAAVFSNLYIFGDSLSDTGNASIAALGLGLPDPSYFSGRISNGPIWVDTLATDYLGLPEPVPALAGGGNYATATAQSGGVAPSLTFQANTFALTQGNFSSTDLVVVWGGSNDLIGGSADPSASVSNINDAVNTLADKGATTILLLNLPDIGDTPRIQATGNSLLIGGASGFSQAFNAGLAASVPVLEANNPGLGIFLLDVFSLGKEVQANPGEFGFTNATDAALLSGVPDGAGYVYYDDLHPTSAVHDLFAQRVAALLVLPEPSAAGLVLLSAAGLLFRRRGRDSSRAAA